MLTRRLIARLDVKPPNLVKGVALEGFRRLGSPGGFALGYYEGGADEIFYQDVVASLYGRSSLVDLVRETTARVFVPVTVGGGIRSVEDIRAMTQAGAEKVAINTAAIARPGLITEAAKAFGSQAVCVAVEYIGAECFTDNGREHTGREVLDWCRQAAEYGAGEILLTSVERDGRGNGLDLVTLEEVARRVSVPIVVHGGAGNPQHVVDAFRSGADGVAVASVLHYRRYTIAQLKAACADADIPMRLAI